MTRLTRRDMMRGTVAASAAAAVATPAMAQGAVPTDWIDPRTGHRIVRLSGDEGGSKAYFYRPIFSPQGDVMAMATPRGIVLVDMKTCARRLLVADPRAELLFTGRRTRTVYYSIVAEGAGMPTQRATMIYAADMDSGRTRRLVRVPEGKVWSLNADETMLVCTLAEGEQPLQPGVPDPRHRRFGQAEYSANGPDGRPLNFAKAKGVRMLQRWAARIPMELFVVDVRTGARRMLLKSNEWLNHAQFSPTDPGQIIFSHEGPWHRVTRMWSIRTDGGEPKPLHRRTMNMEIWGHEFFSPDGKWVWYDLQTPRGQVFWVAGLELATGRRVWRRVEQNDWSVHFNVSPDQTLFAGDGGDRDMVAHAPDGKWIVLLKPEPSVDADLEVYDPDAITPEYLRGERLVDMAAHDYRLEPNLTFTPDNRWIVFGSNMHGSNHVYMVEVAKAAVR